MRIIRAFAILLIILISHIFNVAAQSNELCEKAKEAMLKSSKYMIEEVSTNGGYVWYYLPDLSRRWGEMEAYKTMIWTQSPGTVSVGHMFLNAYNATQNEYYYTAAEKVASALIWGQSNEGGWNYMIDFAGDRSLKKWYNTIGKNGWRLEEFQHYYGNDTFDDDVTSDAARFLLRLYLIKLDPRYKPALDKAINFILKSQYPLGGWPQRYPLKYDFNKAGHPDYSSYYTFNDDVIWENINFLVQCYLTLGEERFLDPIKQGMEFYLISQQANGAWGQQYDMELNPAGARTYEPKALLPGTTYSNAMILIRFYEYTGNKRFLSLIPNTIQWLEKCRLPESMTQNGRYTHPTFVEMGTDKPVFVHRKGSNVKYGYYYTDCSDKNLLAHYGGKNRINIDKLKSEYQRVLALSADEITKNSPLSETLYQHEGTPQTYYDLSRFSSSLVPDDSKVKEILNALDDKGRWLVTGAKISHPYVGDGQNKDLTDEFVSTNVGDETDTSCYTDTSDQKYISTSEFIKNMNLLINYINKNK
jgi:PelA/Pel-15E family pectate lyase